MLQSCSNSRKIKLVCIWSTIIRAKLDQSGAWLHTKLTDGKPNWKLRLAIGKIRLPSHRSLSPIVGLVDMEENGRLLLQFVILKLPFPSFINLIDLIWYMICLNKDLFRPLVQHWCLPLSSQSLLPILNPFPSHPFLIVQYTFFQPNFSSSYSLKVKIISSMRRY